DGVHKPGLRAKAAAFGLLNGFVDGGVIGNAVEPKNLIKAEAQEILQANFLRSSGSFLSD
ncbi:MAG: hypothetical protein QOD03_1630, partial [Verrucomicrobiota bacterium]